LNDKSGKRAIFCPHFTHRLSIVGLAEIKLCKKHFNLVYFTECEDQKYLTAPLAQRHFFPSNHVQADIFRVFNKNFTKP